MNELTYLRQCPLLWQHRVGRGDVRVAQGGERFRHQEHDEAAELALAPSVEDYFSGSLHEGVAGACKPAGPHTQGGHILAKQHAHVGEGGGAAYEMLAGCHGVCPRGAATAAASGGGSRAAVWLGGATVMAGG